MPAIIWHYIIPFPASGHTPKWGNIPLNKGCPASILGWPQPQLSAGPVWAPSVAEGDKQCPHVSTCSHQQVKYQPIDTGHYWLSTDVHLALDKLLKEHTILSVEDLFFLTSQNSFPSQKPTHINLPLSVIITKKREERTWRKKNY